jgi:hypothetical protein
MTMTGRERGPDPIARWLGDDRPKPEPGEFRYQDSAEFLTELDALFTETGEFEYDGTYSQRYAPDVGPTVWLRDVDGDVVAAGVQDETGQFYGTTVSPRSSSPRWRYLENCSCRWCELHRGNRPTHQANPEWQRAAESYTPTPQPSRQPPRLRNWTDEGWDADRHEYDALRRALRGREPEVQVRQLSEYYRTWYGVPDVEPDCDCTWCGPIGVGTEHTLIRSESLCDVSYWLGMQRIIYRRVLRELDLPDDWEPSSVRLLREAFARLNVTIVPMMREFATGVRRVRAALTELSDAVRDDPLAYDRWADDGGTIGMTDY